MRVILYARVSTEEQAHDGVSLRAQIAKLTAYCDLYDLEAVETVVDAGASAKSLQRDGLQKALHLLQSGQADGLIVFKLDRLTRSIVDWQYLINRFFCERAGKQLFSVCDSVDTRSASGRMVLNIMLTIAQWERETIGERTAQALQYKISRGERCGRVRYGYDLSDDGKTLMDNEREQQAIGVMHQLRAQGLTYRAIAAELSARGIPAKTATAWSHAAVRQIVNRKLQVA